MCILIYVYISTFNAFPDSPVVTDAESAEIAETPTLTPTQTTPPREPEHANVRAHRL